jgi:hypothetical protein
MKKIIGVLCVLAIFIVGCAMLGNPKKVACEAACDSTYDSCKADAKDDAAALAACEAKKLACYKGCEKL